MNALDTDSVEAVKSLTSGGVDHAIEVIGKTATIEQAFQMLRTRGTATVVGVTTPGDLVRIPADALLDEKRLQGSRSGSGRFRLDIPLYCRMYLDGRLMLDELIAEHISLSEINRAMQDLDVGAHLRAVVMFEEDR